MSIALPARAKLNLDLAVLGRLPDGFHEISTTMQSIELHDTLELAIGERTHLTTSGWEIPSDESNSVRKAHAALEAAVHRTLPTGLHLHKRIPAGSGMGGASSDAAATLRGLKVLHGLDVDLGPIAARIGADVPFFLHGGRMRAEGRGDRLTALPFEEAWFAVAWPRVELSTADVYRAWDEVQGEGRNQLLRAAAQVNAAVRSFSQQLGEGWSMTGSGSAFFIRCASEEEAKIAAANLDCWTATSPAVGPWP